MSISDNSEISEELKREILYCRLAMKRLKWRQRLVPMIRPHYCMACLRKGYCRRLEGNEMIFNKILSGGECNDYQSFWKVI